MPPAGSPLFGMREEMLDADNVRRVGVAASDLVGSAGTVAPDEERGVSTVTKARAGGSNCQKPKPY